MLISLSVSLIGRDCGKQVYLGVRIALFLGGFDTAQATARFIDFFFLARICSLKHRKSEPSRRAQQKRANQSPSNGSIVFSPDLVAQ
ncbi:hypothetical protein ZEAMMB73_Zm00001d016229 [Zea mays]|uniref:Uncharacterized protein n=1 Tax=Zea mays TaxID=4577 RepID=A0A1D6H6C5_MAIZE|nr:hypothetical protein ZEAMMB73_Zm00001d016229 [Zea mays]